MTRRFHKFPPEIVTLCRCQGIRLSDVKDFRVGEEFALLVTFTGKRACLPLADLVLDYKDRINRPQEV